jgi:hypothetical protein
VVVDSKRVHQVRANNAAPQARNLQCTGPCLRLLNKRMLCFYSGATTTTPEAVGCDEAATAGTMVTPVSTLGSSCGTVDVNGDGHVAVGDLLLVLAAFGVTVVLDEARGCVATALAEDVNGDCAVTVADLLLTLAMFGATC